MNKSSKEIPSVKGKVKIIAKPEKGYNFDYWKVNGVKNRDLKSNFEWESKEKTTFEAVFKYCGSNRITTQVSDPKSGNIIIKDVNGEIIKPTTSNSYIIEGGSEIIIHINIVPGYEFVSCTVDDQVYDKQDDIRTIVDGDMTICLVTKKGSPNIVVSCDPPEGGCISVDNKV